MARAGLEPGPNGWWVRFFGSLTTVRASSQLHEPEWNVRIYSATIGYFRVPRASVSKQGYVLSLALIRELFFILMLSKSHFHKKDCALGLILKVRVFGTWKWPI